MTSNFNLKLPANMPRSIVMLTTDDWIDRRILDQARSLTQNGWQVTVLAYPPSKENRDEIDYSDVKIIRTISAYSGRDEQGNLKTQPRPLPATADGAKIEQILRSLPQWPWMEHFFSFPYILTEAFALPPASVYTAHDLPLLPGAALLARYYQSYLVYDSHEIYPAQASIKPFSGAGLWKIEEQLIPLADRVIVINRSIADFMQKNYAIEMPEVVHNSPAVDVPNPPLPKQDLLRQTLPIKPDTKIMLYQGNIVMEARNLENMVTGLAATRRKDVALVLMGSDSYGAGEQLQQLANKHGLPADQFYIHPRVSQNDLLNYTASADIGIIPYFNRGLQEYFVSPNKLNELISAGLPILANDCPELNRFISAQGLGLNLPLNTSTQFASAITAMLDSDLSFFRTNIAAVAAQHSWKHEEQQTLRIYSSIFEQNLPPKSAFAELMDTELLCRRGHYGAALRKLNTEVMPGVSR